MVRHKIVCILACVVVMAVSSLANPGGHAQSYQKFHLHTHGGGGWGCGSDCGSRGDHDDHHHSHAKYNFKYGGEDHHTGDHKGQKEEGDEGAVYGEYSLLQPDGRKRVVHYTADKHGEFHAHVTYSGHAIYPYHHHH